MINNYLNFLELNEKNTKKETTKEKKIKMENAIYKQDIETIFDYDTNQEIKIIKTTTPINNKEVIISLKKEVIKDQKGLK